MPAHTSTLEIPDTSSIMKRFPLKALSKRFSRYKSNGTVYVTTPIFYVNARPHLGHLYSMLLGDTRVRWENLKPGQKTMFLTGTDEHGLKIQAVAEKEGIDPKVLVDRVSQNFVQMAEAVNVKYDRFIRTTDNDHVKAVEHFWNAAMEKGLIYKGSHSGWYSVSDEAFYPPSQVEDIIDAKTGQPKKVSIETRNEVVFQEEENYFFRLSAFKDKLIDFLEKNPSFVQPSRKYHELLTELRQEELSDLSVSRPSWRLKWGITVPNDDSQKIYVWFDALINYLTAAGYPQQDMPIWPPIHIVGKDIMRFHCIYWPIFLMAAGIELPKQVIVHSHWLCDGFKMSKSLGNVVEPIELAQYYDPEPLRIYLMEQSNLGTDCNFSEAALHNHRSRLINKWANIVSRIGGDKFDVEQSVQDFFDGKYSDITEMIKRDAVVEAPDQVLLARDSLVSSISSLFSEMDSSMQEFGQMKALHRWWETVELANVFFQTAQPWVYLKKLTQTQDADADAAEEQKTLMNYIIFLTAEAVRVSTICVLPFMPKTASGLLDRLGVPDETRNKDFAKLGTVKYGKNANSKHHKPLMRKVESRV